MKILYFISTLETGGLVHQMYSIIRFLDRARFEPVIITLSPEPSKTCMSLFQNEGVQVRSLGISRIQGVFSGASVLLRAVRGVGPDIIHSHGFRPDMFAAGVLKEYLRVSTLHNNPYEDYPPQYGLGGYLMATQHVRALKKIPWRVTVSEANRAKLVCRGLDFHVIPNGVDSDLFFPITEDQERLVLRGKLDLPLDKKIFISVGSMISRKDPHTVIKGFRKSNISSRAILLLIGDGRLKKDCEQASVDHPSIFYLGHVRNVRDYLQAADYFVSASTAEGLPMAVLEALACGLPVCLSDIPEHTEIVKYAAESVGVCFKRKCSDDCARAMDYLGSISPGEMRRSAVRVASEHLSAKNMSKNYQKFYEEIAGKWKMRT